MAVAPSTVPESSRHRPKWITVFAAAFVAGATAAVGVNSFLDVHLSRRKPQVECEPIFVALRSLPQGAPVTVWDVALKDWPKAMLPAAALRAHDSFDGFVLRHAVREGQPLLSVQLVRAEGEGQHRATAAGESFTAPTPAAQEPAANSTQTDLWAPAESISERKATPRPQAESAAQPQATPSAEAAPAQVATKPAAASTDIDPPALSTAASDGKPVTETPAASASTKTTPEAPAAEAVAVTDPAQPPVAPPDPQPLTRVETAAQAVEPAAAAPVAPIPSDVDSPALAATQPPVGEPTPAADIATMPSVVVPDVGARPAQEAPAPAGSGGRFLVVPERIALQADTSFAAPRRPQPPSVAPQSRTKQPPTRGTTGSRRETSSRGQAQPQPRSPSTPTAGQRTWGSFFPNIAAGMGAISGQPQRTRATTSDQKAPARR